MATLALRIALVAIAVALAGGLWWSQVQGAWPVAAAASTPAPPAGHAAPVSADGDGGHAHAHAAPVPAAAALDGDSLFHLRDAWTDQRGHMLRLADLAGHPTVVVMFYGNCMTACPVLLRDAERIEAALPVLDRARTRFLMVTFDPASDTPERMAAYAAEKGLDRERWSFLTADDRAVRRLAGALGVRYRPDGQGGFAHSNLVTLLDPGGVVALRREGLGLDPEPVVAAIAGM
jgi:protein SCO1